MFLPARVSVCFRVGDTILDTALDAGISVNHDCGGNCACTSCHVCVLAGADGISPMEAPEREMISAADGRQANSRLACQAILEQGDVVVVVCEAH